MSRQSNAKLIGAFVIGALVLLVAAVVVFGSGKLFTDTLRFVAYFDGSVKGLAKGAPVSFRGVRVGSVSDIRVVYMVKEKKLYIPVLLELDRSQVKLLGGQAAGLPSRHEAFEALQDFVSSGLRAQLALDSFVTGQLYVLLDFFPDSPVEMRSVEENIPELPTVPSGLEKLRGRLEQIPIEEIAQGLRELIAKLDRVVSSPEFEESIRNMNETLKYGEKLVQDLDAQLVPFIGSMSEHLRGVSGDARNALQAAEKTFKTAASALSDRSPLLAKLDNALTEFAGASRAVRLLADYIERHPEAFLTGKKDKGVNR